MIDAMACANFLQLPLIGGNVVISQPSVIGDDSKGSLKFASHYSENNSDLLNTNPCSLVIAALSYQGHLKVPHVLSGNPRLDFCKVTELFFPLKQKSGIESTAFISPTAKVGKNVYVGHGVILEDNVIIGDNTVILHNVVISEGVQIGANCLIKSGSIIGQRGFGFERDRNGIPITFNHYGSVTIGDFVEVGALNTIVAGGLTDTQIADYVKTDDHVHIAHNVTIGKATFITACAEISGSVTIGDKVWIGPNCSIIDSIVVEDGAFIGIGAVITKSIPKEVVVAGNPAKKIGVKKMCIEEDTETKQSPARAGGFAVRTESQGDWDE